MRAFIGLDRVQHTLSAAAPLPVEVARFFAGLGLRILDVYGMTETTGAATANTPDAFKLGTVGRAMPGIELRLAGDGEILLRGSTCTPGYLDRPEATAELLDDEGWVHTGDIGVIDADGFLTIVDRKKEIIITAGGENIAPFADREPPQGAPPRRPGPRVRRPAPVRRRRPHPGRRGRHRLGRGARHRGRPGDAHRAPARPGGGRQRGRTSANERLARVQQVKKWRLLPEEWTAESEELTPTLKLKRRVIHDRYAEVIAGLYV